MCDYEEKLDKIVELVNKRYVEDFDFTVEHWDNGNFDDSYSYGYSSGEQDLLEELKGILGV